MRLTSVFTWSMPHDRWSHEPHNISHMAWADLRFWKRSGAQKSWCPSKICPQSSRRIILHDFRMDFEVFWTKVGPDHFDWPVQPLNHVDHLRWIMGVWCNECNLFPHCFLDGMPQTPFKFQICQPETPICDSDRFCLLILSPLLPAVVKRQVRFASLPSDLLRLHWLPTKDPFHAE